MKVLSLNMVKMPRMRSGKFSVFFCVDDVIATIAAYYQRSYEWMYCQALEFTYDCSKVRIGEGVSVADTFYKQLEQQCGIVAEVIKKQDNMVELIKAHIDKEQPVLIAMNAYWCPWDWRYQEIEDGGHALIVYGYDEDSFICMDPYYEKEECKLSKEELAKGIVEVVTFEKKGTDSIDGYKILSNSIEQYSNGKIHEQIVALAKDITERFTLMNEVLEYDDKEELDMEEVSSRVPLEHALTMISNNRQRYAVMLKKIKEQLGRADLEQLVQEMINLSEAWDVARYALLKGVLTNKTTKVIENVPDKLVQLAQKEDDFLTHVQYFLSNDSSIVNEAVFENEVNVIQERFQFDINELLDNEGFGSEDNTTANFNERRDYYLWKEDKDSIQWNDWKFQLVGLNDGEKDNFICNGQKIEVTQTEIKQCAFLFASDFEECIEDIHLTYTDGTKEQVRIKVSDWQPELAYGKPDNIVGNYDVVEQVDDEKDIFENSAYLYAQSIRFNSTKSIKTLEFPKSTNIHIFAICFGK